MYRTLVPVPVKPGHPRHSQRINNALATELSDQSDDVAVFEDLVVVCSSGTTVIEHVVASPNRVCLIRDLEMYNQVVITNQGDWRGEADGEWYPIADPYSVLNHQYELLRKFVEEEAQLVGYEDQVDNMLSLPVSKLIAVSSQAWIDLRGMPPEARRNIIGDLYVGPHVSELIKVCEGPRLSDDELKHVRRVANRQRIPRFVN